MRLNFWINSQFFCFSSGWVHLFPRIIKFLAIVTFTAGLSIFFMLFLFITCVWWVLPFYSFIISPQRFFLYFFDRCWIKLVFIATELALHLGPEMIDLYQATSEIYFLNVRESKLCSNLLGAQTQWFITHSENFEVREKMRSLQKCHHWIFCCVSVDWKESQIVSKLIAFLNNLSNHIQSVNIILLVHCPLNN